MTNNIMIVEDEAIIRFGTSVNLKSFGYDIVGNFKTGEEAIENFTDLKVDLILIDIKLGGDIDGIETIKRIKEVLDVPVIYVSVHSDTETIERAMATKPFRYIIKPFNEDELKFSIETAIKLDKLEKKIKKYENLLKISDELKD